MKLSWSLTLAVAMSALQGALADNPVVQTKFTADPAPVVINGAVYLYADHDEDNAHGFQLKNWLCYTTTDMVNWTDHGVVADLHDFKWADPKISGWGGFDNGAWAPQCVERAGKFYFYCPLQGRGIGVLVADSPLGPFVDPIGKPLIGGQYDSIDPTVFIDKDGQAYLYWGNPQLHYCKLNKDMISYDQAVGIVKVPLTVESFGQRPSDAHRNTLYEEGPWFYRRGSLYYMVYAAGGIPEFIAYATSPGPTGPWTYRGIIMPKNLPNLAFTNHPAVLDYKGHTYFFYHNQALPGGAGFDRSICVEEFKYNPDGSIPTVLPTTEGPAPVRHLNPYVSTPAATIAWEVGVKTEISPTSGVYVTNIRDSDYIKVRSVNFGARRVKVFSACVASAASGSSIEVHLDSVNGPLAATVAVPNTGGPDHWSVSTASVTGATGIRDVYFVFKGTPGTTLFDFLQWKFSK